VVSRPHIAVVIATTHRPDDLLHVLDSVLACAYERLDVVVVGQSDGLVPARPDPRVRFHRPSAPGLSAALNSGIRAAEAELIAITGDDCVVDPHWPDRIADAFEASPRAAIAFGGVSAGPCDPSIGFVPGCSIETEVVIDSLTDVHRLSGTTACMALRRSAWSALGGFDERLGLGAPFHSAEDLDLALRALRAGYPVVQTPQIRVEHRTPVRWEERSSVIRRNWFGSGAAFAKNLKLSPPPMALALANLTGRWIAGGSGVAATYGVKPDRGAMLAGFASGFAAGLVRPVDRRRQLFKPLEAAIRPSTSAAARPLE
jgi:GT2 family glycosyltransferase